MLNPAVNPLFWVVRGQRVRLMTAPLYIRKRITSLSMHVPSHERWSNA